MIIARRFRGPPGSANGGYACGAVAGLLGDVDAQATLRLPPPLEHELTEERPDRRAVLRDGDAIVAEAVATTVELDVPAAVSFDEAERAARGYPWFQDHPFPGCFVCGPARAAGDGLRIFPGAVPGRAIAAAPWTPDASLVDDDGLVARPIVWAALDCPSWFGHACFHPWTEGGVLLGRLAAHVETRPRAGERCVAIGWSLGRDGRKIAAGSAIVGEDGRVHAYARATWIALR